MVKIVDVIEKANAVTHCGTMHADEIFATAFLDLYLGDIKVYRANNVDNIKLNDDVIVYDIGRGRFDHHQNDALKRENGITYCSFGLLWKEFGKKFLKQQDIYYVDDVFNFIDKDFVEAIDGDDNGTFPKIEAIYKVKTLSSIFKLFNPSFDSCQDESTQFVRAVNVAKIILEEEITYANGRVLADKKVSEILENCANDKYMILDNFIPYEDTILNSSNGANILFVAFPSNRGGYAIKTVPKSIDDHTARVPFPEDWGGKVGEELEKVSGIKGLKFCHTGRFIVSCSNLTAVYKVLDKLCQ